MEEQKDIVAGNGDMGHTMRLGSYPAELEEGSIVKGEIVRVDDETSYDVEIRAVEQADDDGTAPLMPY